MTRPLAIIRPEPGWSTTATAARELGIDIIGHPLFEAEPVVWNAPDPAGFDALLVGSANVLRHGGKELDRLRSLPVLAVGQTTAQAAREAGFEVAQGGRGGLQQVVESVDPRFRRLLRLSGEQRVALDEPDGVSIREIITYRVRALPMRPAFISGLAGGAIIALHSGEAARHFRRECEAHKLDIKNLSLMALGPRIADLAGSGWKSIHIAEAAEDGALLASARALCQEA